MFWIVILLLIGGIAVWAESLSGKIVLGGLIVAAGAGLLSWITDADYLLTVAKYALIVVVVTIVAAMLSCIINA